MLVSRINSRFINNIRQKLRFTSMKAGSTLSGRDAEEVLQPEDLNWYKSKHRMKLTQSHQQSTEYYTEQQQHQSIEKYSPHNQTESTIETLSNHAFDVVSFNLLAPVYKRLSSLNTATGRRHREDSNLTLWKDRLTQTIDFFRTEIYNDAAIIALQEYWLDPEYRTLFETQFQQHGYEVYILQRTGAKMDAVAVAIKSDIFEVCGIENVHLCTYGDRVALLLWLKHRSTGFDLLAANTHLSFPHNTIDKINQVAQMKKLTSVIHKYASDHCIVTAPALIMGDFNVESYSPVCDLLKKAGYYSCFEISPPVNTTTDADGSSKSDDSSSGSCTAPAAPATTTATTAMEVQDSELEVPNHSGRVVQLGDSSIQQQQQSASHTLQLDSTECKNIDEYTATHIGGFQNRIHDEEDVGDDCIDSIERAYISDTAQYTADEKHLFEEINMTEHNRQSVSYISHYNHRNESVGVDHIFIKPISILNDSALNPHSTTTTTSDRNQISMWEKVIENKQKIENLFKLDPVELLPDRKDSERINKKERILDQINIYIAECQVLPKRVTCSVWDPEFSISDHRPVRTKIIFSQQSTGET